MTRVGVALLPEVNPATDDRWARLQDYGFAHAWSLDHLAWRSLADSPWHATVPTLAAAAMTTTTIPLGTFVSSPNFRHPVTFAKEAMTLDVMSGGRLQLAVGAGAPGYDASILGGPELTAKQKADRFEEFVDMLDLLLRQPRTTRPGRWFSAVEARTIPGPAQQPRPPMYVAANGPRGMRLAIDHADGWVTTGLAPFGAENYTWWKGVAAAAERFNDAADRAGGTPAGFTRYLDLQPCADLATSAEQVRDAIGRAGDLGFTDVVIAWPREHGIFQGSEAVLEQIASHLDSNGELQPIAT